MWCKQIKSSVYHPQTNTFVERRNLMIKNALRTLTAEKKHDWDILLPYLLFSIREIPCVTTGFSPFELLYARQVKGPLSLLKDQWTDSNDSSINVVKYVLDMRNKLSQMQTLARENAEYAYVKQSTWYDKKARDRTFKVGELVLVLRLKKTHNLECSWSGPFPVLKKLNDVNYIIAISTLFIYLY